MLLITLLIASALMFFFAFCALRALRDYSGTWVIYSFLAGIMFAVDCFVLCITIGG